MKKIMKTVQEHHDTIQQKILGYTPVMTVLVGSQNYKIEHKDSDIDTYTFVLPSINELSTAAEPLAHEHTLEDGSKCFVKDMRIALNLLQKTNPNSIEWFCSDYVVYNPLYEELIKKYISKEKRNRFLYCDMLQMANSCMGMSTQLKNRNMPTGKKFSHALRVRDMWTSYLLEETDNILKFRDEDTRKIAAAAKLSDKEEYQQLTEEVAQSIAESVDKFKSLEPDKLQEIGERQKACKKYVHELQYYLTAKHIALELAKVF